MNITHEYGINGDKKLRYNMVEGSGPSLADYIGQRLTIKAYVIFENPPKEEGGEPVKVIKLMLDDGKTIAGTTSKSFINSFERYLECIESDECTEVEIQQMKSKSGRPYLIFRA